jgi:protein-serine/threonine kinase
MSDDGSQPDKKHPAPPPRSSNPTQTPSDDMSTSADEIAGKLNEVFPSPMDTSSQPTGPSLAPMKGKLYVKISEAKGLRPGFDPYVVCVFEWNECISKSVQDEEQESIKRQQKEQNHRDQLDLDAGRPMAIPMKSRQSSHNSALDPPSEHRGQAPVTDPHWNHEAVL